MNAIEINNLSKTYESKAGNVEALKDVSFSIKQGEFFGLLGPNGAGKSTMISILGGVIKKTSGSASVLGISIDENHNEAKKLLGIVPQEVSFDPFSSLIESLKYQYGFYGVKYSEKKADELLKKLGLLEKKNDSLRSLSGGMKRRFMIARAMVHEPKVLILDEPTAGVDIELRHDLYDLVRKLNAEGVTIILTSHYLEEVELLCDRVGIISKGNLVALDHKDALKQRFQSTRQLSLSLTKQLDTLPEALSKFEPKQNNTELVLTFEEAEYKSVLETVAKLDLPIANFSVIEPSLEDVFLSLTK